MSSRRSVVAMRAIIRSIIQQYLTFQLLYNHTINITESCVPTLLKNAKSSTVNGKQTFATAAVIFLLFVCPQKRDERKLLTGCITDRKILVTMEHIY